jgi:hypothetical protein
MNMRGELVLYCVLLQVTAKDVPTATLISLNDDALVRKYPWPAGEALTAARFGAFIGDWEAGKLKSKGKSEPEPGESP